MYNNFPFLEHDNKSCKMAYQVSFVIFSFALCVLKFPLIIIDIIC